MKKSQIKLFQELSNQCKEDYKNRKKNYVNDYI